MRVLVVIAGAEFKLKYSGSALGYVWSVLKPLALFTMLYVVFGRVFKLGRALALLPVSLLIGIVLFTFFADATTLGLISIVVARRRSCASSRSRASSSRPSATLTAGDDASAST